MSAEKRISKHSMKEDRLVSTTFKATEYIQKNQTPFVIGTIAIVVIFGAILLIRWSGSRKLNDSAALLSRAEMVAAMGQMDQYLTDLQLLSDDYTGTTAGKVATLRLANAYFDQRQFDQAETYFTRLIDKYSNDNMAAAAGASGKAACLEIKGNYLEAAKYYQKAADFKSGDLWTPGYLLKAGQNFARAGDKTSAIADYDLIQKQYPNSAEGSPAKRYLAELQN